MSWTDERVELLKKLWADGLSASQIAGELGGITRNAVIGKVHRLGLSGRAKSPSSSAPRARKPRSHMMRVQRPMSRGNTALALAYEMDHGARAGADREHHPDRTAPHAAGAQRGHLPLADRRSGDLRILLLRRQAAERPALLQLSLARRLSAGQRAPQPQAPVPPGLEIFLRVLARFGPTEAGLFFSRLNFRFNFQTANMKQPSVVAPVLWRRGGVFPIFPSPLNEGMERREAPGSLRGSLTDLARVRLYAPTAISPLPGIAACGVRAASDVAAAPPGAPPRCQCRAPRLAPSSCAAIDDALDERDARNIRPAWARGDKFLFGNDFKERRRG